MTDREKLLCGNARYALTLRPNPKDEHGFTLDDGCYELQVIDAISINNDDDCTWFLVKDHKTGYVFKLEVWFKNHWIGLRKMNMDILNSMGIEVPNYFAIGSVKKCNESIEACIGNYYKATVQNSTLISMEKIDYLAH